jgi:release factor glutamine methyltransferase
VLIPRADTEILVEEVINRISAHFNPVVVDIGCGSGAIAVSIAKYVKNSEVYALDIMDTPLEITKLNAVGNGVGDRVHVLKSNVLKALNKEHENKIDVIVSNPPYIEEADIPNLMMDVKNYEPKIALSGGIDGLCYYRSITRDCIIYLKNEGLLAYEIGYNQAEAVMHIMEAEGFYNIELIRDLGGNDRVVLGRIKKP